MKLHITISRETLLLNFSPQKMIERAEKSAYYSDFHATFRQRDLKTNFISIFGQQVAPLSDVRLRIYEVSGHRTTREAS